MNFISIIIGSMILTALICGFLSMNIADEKNRNRLGWFLMGFFFNICGVIAICTIDKLAGLKERNDIKKQIERDDTQKQILEELKKLNGKQ